MRTVVAVMMLSAFCSLNAVPVLADDRADAMEEKLEQKKEMLEKAAEQKKAAAERKAEMLDKLD